METVVSTIWQKTKLLVKGLIIGAMALLLLIPAYFVQELVKEREARQRQAFAEVSSKWAGRQNITGPVLVLPYWQKQSENEQHIVNVKHYAYFLPDELAIDATVAPKEKYRGIYKVMLYSSSAKITGKFVTPALEKLGISPQDVIWSEAVLRLHLSDKKGLNEEFGMTVNDSLLSFSPEANEDPGFPESLNARLNLTSIQDLKTLDFSGVINFNGSTQLLFTPVGKNSSVSVHSDWPHPSFTGNILPQNSSINAKGFNATWKSVSHTRNFPQQWKDNAFYVEDYFPTLNDEPMREHVPDAVKRSITTSAFGTDLFIPVSDYQKTERSVKYAILCILLTFTAFFLIETNNRKSVHPLQYALIGFALIIFYTLLLSFSEYVGFNASYVIASIATVGLIGWFVKGLLGSMKLSAILSIVLVLLYSYVFTILQLQDYSLLIGSVGLFLALGVVMYYSRKLQW